MRYRVFARLAACLALALWVAGCGRREAPPTVANDPPPAEVAEVAEETIERRPIRTESAEDLPPLGYYLPAALDEGRVEIAPPENWHVAGRSARYLALFSKARNVEVPRILVTVEESPFEQIRTATKDNLEQFAGLVARELADGEVELLEPVVPLILGDTPYARYVRSGRHKKRTIELQVLQTLADGRLYVVELAVFPDAILQYRDEAYAVAAGMKFLKRPADDNGATPDSEQAENDQADDVDKADENA